MVQNQKSLYPTEEFEDSYDSNTPELFAGAVACTFLLVTVAFFVYDLFVERRHNRLVEKAAKLNAIVSSMFPGMIRDRLIGVNADGTTTEANNKRGRTNANNKNLKTFLTSRNGGGGGCADQNDLPPLADLFLETTVSVTKKLFNPCALLVPYFACSL